MPDLSRIRTILVEPQYGGNIGQCARAMLNMGLSRLVLVAPVDHLGAEALWMAREAKGILEQAQVCASLEEALAPVSLAIGTTRRVGKYRRPVMTPRQVAEKLPSLLPANEVAFVYGREISGLTGEELDRCQWLVSIPASEVFPSLNLAQAVLVCSYELFVAAGGEERKRDSADAPALAGPQLLERFYEHLEEVLGEIRFLVGDQAPAIMRTLRRIFGRAALEPRDLKILHGILAQMDWYRRRALSAAGPPIRWAAEKDVPEIVSLLETCGLPAAGLSMRNTRILLARREDEIAGCVAVEFYEDCALLRSLAVAEGYRGSGLGRSLAGDAVAEARRRGMCAVFLLTTSAQDFFARLGFVPVGRDEVPTSIRRSPEWSESFCATAGVMRLGLP